MARAKASPADAALERVRTICMAFPAAREKLSRGAPVFHVRDRLFVMFVDDHHQDGRLAVWCKAALEDQRRLVAEDPVRYFVPPYVGVQGWVGVRLDRPSTDWVELAIIAEKGWTSVAPASVRSGKWVPTAPAAPPPLRPKTDARIAKVALERVTDICFALSDVTCERQGQHAAFRVRKKVFAYFLDNHHGDGIVSVCVKAPKNESAALARKEPRTFYQPAYIGKMGYVGIRLDAARVDWKAVAARIAASHAAATSRPAKARGSARARQSPR